MPEEALGLTLWSVEGQNFAKISSRTANPATRIDLPHSPQQHAMHLYRVAQSQQPDSAEAAAADITDESAAAISYPLVVEGNTQAIVELYHRPALPPSNRDAFVKLLESWNASVRRPTEEPCHANSVSPLAVERQLSESIHRHLSVQRCGFALVNDARRVLSCDRVSALVTKRGRLKTIAVSGTDEVNRRSNEIQSLEQLAHRALRGRLDLAYPKQKADLPPQLDEVLQEHLEQSLARELRLCLLREPPETANQDGDQEHNGTPFGALVFEWYSVPNDDMEANDRLLGAVTRPGELALNNALRFEAIFLMPVMRWLGNLFTNQRTALLAATLATVAVMLALRFAPLPLELRVEGQLLPTERRHIYAPDAGVIDRHFVEHGDVVEANSPLLKLRNHELDLALESINGKIEQTRSDIRALHGRRLRNDNFEQESAAQLVLTADQQTLKSYLKSLQLQKVLIQSRRDSLTVNSPMAGTVVTWTADEQLHNKPVLLGEPILEIADLTGDWKLELNVPERDLADLRRAQQGDQEIAVTFMLAADTQKTFRGSVDELANRLDPATAQSTARLAVRVDDADIPRHAGATVQAKLHCGTRPAGYVLFRGLWHFLKTKIWFYCS